MSVNINLLLTCSDVHPTRSFKKENHGPDEDAVLSALVNCTHLRLNGKNLGNIDKIAICPNVRIIHAFENNITDITPLYNCRNLANAYFQNNKIPQIPLDFGYAMRNLTRLHLNRNCIDLFRGWAGVQAPMLEELHIAGQDVPEIEFEDASMKALSQCLKVIDVSNNKLKAFNSFHSLRALRSFFAEGNEVHELEDVKRICKRNPSLLVVSVLDNPCASGVTKLRLCRDAVVLACSAVEVVNGKNITAAERTFLREKAHRVPINNK